MKKIKNIYEAEQINMGGIILDQALPLNNLPYIDPFLLIHHWKQEFNGNQKQRDLGVGPHPHRGFSPVTLIFEGGVYHQDSIGNKSVVEKGGLQWMNSGKGIIHSERPSTKLATHGGIFEIIQFWLNTPKKYKMKDPVYLPVDVNEIPSVIYDGGLVKVNLIAGEFEGIKSRIKTHSKVLVLSLNLFSGAKISIPIPEDYNAMVYQLNGKLNINNIETFAKNLSVFERVGDYVNMEAHEDTKAVLFAGVPLNEPVVSYGPFVMNSQNEIYQAVKDYNSGNMGYLYEEFNEKIKAD